MVYLANHYKDVIPLKEVSEKESLSFDYLEKIVAKLEKAKLVKAKKGAYGGYYLTKAPSKIKANEIIWALEGKRGLVKCLAGGKEYSCPLMKKCLAKNLWVKLQKSLNSTLSSITLSELIK